MALTTANVGDACEQSERGLRRANGALGRIWGHGALLVGRGASQGGGAGGGLISHRRDWGRESGCAIW